MDKRAKADFVILTSALTGVAAAETTKQARHSSSSDSGRNPAILAAFLTSVSITHRGTKLTGLYPERLPALAGLALSLGVVLGLAAGRFGRG
jgi:hypothetical protein